MGTDPAELSLLACATLRRETEAVLSSGGFDGVKLRSFAWDCGRPQPPESLLEGLERGLEGDFDAIVLGASCLSALAPSSPGSFPLAHRVDQCARLLADDWIVDGLLRDGAYILTPGWLSGWKARLGLWGFDRESAALFFGESCSELALLDTGLDERSAGMLQEFADYVGRPSRVLPVGLGHYRLLLQGLVAEARLARKARALEAELRGSAARKAETAMFLDLMTNVAGISTEAEAIDRIFDIFEMLFAPREMTYVAVRGGKATECRSRHGAEIPLSVCQDWLDAGRADSARESEAMFLRISFHDELLGLLEISGLAVPERQDDYMGLALLIMQVCGLAISNARTYQALETLAVTDPLTGLASRRRFFELAAQEHERARRYGRQLSVLMLDIDHFKMVNDKHGHQAGDKVLAEVAACVRSELRASDLAARYGGEEFVVLMPETELPIALRAAERIRKSIAALSIDHGAGSLSVTMSLGVASMEGSPPGPDLHALLGHADAALYAAKSQGRNRALAWSAALPSPGES